MNMKKILYMIITIVLLLIALQSYGQEELFGEEETYYTYYDSLNHRVDSVKLTIFSHTFHISSDTIDYTKYSDAGYTKYISVLVGSLHYLKDGNVMIMPCSIYPIKQIVK